MVSAGHRYIAALACILLLGPGQLFAQTVIRGPSFERADTDGNGYLTRDEARAAGLRDVFEQLDRDADSRLEPAEFQAAVRAPGLLVVPDAAEERPAAPAGDTGPPTAGGVAP